MLYVDTNRRRARQNHQAWRHAAELLLKAAERNGSVAEVRKQVMLAGRAAGPDTLALVAYAERGMSPACIDQEAPVGLGPGPERNQAAFVALQEYVGKSLLCLP